MSELNYRCPKCGQDERFYCDEVTGVGANMWEVTEDGIIERHNGGGNHWDIGDASYMHCPKCGFNARRHHFEKPAPFDACPKCGEHENIEYGHVRAEGGYAWHSVECMECGNRYTLEYEFKCVDWEEA